VSADFDVPTRSAIANGDGLRGREGHDSGRRAITASQRMTTRTISSSVM
jgi:hypothetical protein